MIEERKRNEKDKEELEETGDETRRRWREQGEMLKMPEEEG